MFCKEVHKFINIILFEFINMLNYLSNVKMILSSHNYITIKKL